MPIKPLPQLRHSQPSSIIGDDTNPNLEGLSVQRFALACLIILLSSLIVACGGEAPPANNTSNNSNPTSAPDRVPINAPDGVVARVNGEDITQQQFDATYARFAGNSAIADPTALQSQVLATLIEQTLIRQAAGEMGISVTDAEVDAEINGLKQNIATSDGAWLAWLNTNGYANEADLRNDLQEALLTNKVRDQLISGLTGNVQQVNARHILVRTEAEAGDVLQRLQNGEGFEVLAAQFSQDVTTKDFGGNLGWFTRDELMDVTLADIAFGLQVGEIAGPISTRLGYHIIQTLDKSERPVEPERLPMLMENLFTNWLDSQLTNAVIERF